MYNYSEITTILDQAKKIENKSVRELIKYGDMSSVYDSSSYNLGKGTLGQLVEEFVFGYKPNSSKDADFNEAGVELKVVPLKTINRNSKSSIRIKQDGLSVKERIVLSIINYEEVVNETWDTNSLSKKLLKLLLMFYKYEKGVDVTELTFKLVDVWEPSESDLEIIKQDWEFIVNKIRKGRAHELSEGDTYYLGACTKGASKSSTRPQPFSDVMAMQRAFSLKRNFADEIFNSLYTRQQKKHKKPMYTIESRLMDLLGLSKNRSLKAISESYNLASAKSKAKNRLNLVTVEILSKVLGEPVKKHDQIVKAGIEIKTILLQPNGVPKESMSFEQINYDEIVEQAWDTSDVRSAFESKKHLWVVFQSKVKYSKQSELSDGDIFLSNIYIWNMPSTDLEGPYQILWQDTKQKIDKMDFNHFMKSNDNTVGHIRPKAKDSKDKALFRGSYVPKKCFWLNAKYIADQIQKMEKE